MSPERAHLTIPAGASCGCTATLLALGPWTEGAEPPHAASATARIMTASLDIAVRLPVGLATGPSLKEDRLPPRPKLVHGLLDPRADFFAQLQDEPRVVRPVGSELRDVDRLAEG